MPIRSDAGGETKGPIEYIQPLRHGYLMGFRESDSIGITASTIGHEVKFAHSALASIPAQLATRFVADITDQLCSRAPQHPPKIGIILDHYPSGMRVVMKAEDPARGAQLMITIIDGCRVRLFVTHPSCPTPAPGPHL